MPFLETVLPRVTPSRREPTPQELENVRTEITGAEEQIEAIRRRELVYSPDHPIGIYFQQIAESPRLSPQAQQELVLRVRSNPTSAEGVQARNTLITAFLPYVVFLAKGEIGKGPPFDELIAEGNKKLVESLSDIYAYRTKYALTSYLWWRVKGGLWRFETKYRGLKSGEVASLKVYNRAVDILRQKQGHEPNIDEITWAVIREEYPDQLDPEDLDIHRTTFTNEEYRTWRKRFTDTRLKITRLLYGASAPAISLEEPPGEFEDEDTTLADLIIDLTKAGDLQEEVYSRERSNLVNLLLSNLTQAEREFVDLRFVHGKTLDELALERQTPLNDIRNFEKKILNKLRKNKPLIIKLQDYIE